jgi:hypothetical protein
LIDALQQLVAQLENEPALLEPSQFRQRLEALDRLDAFFPDTPQPSPEANLITAELHQRARAINDGLEAANRELYAAIRREIQSGARPDTLLQWVHSSPGIGDGFRPAAGNSYDYLDELISGVLQFDEPGAAHIQREPEMVFYQPTPARHIFDLIRLTLLTAADVLIDLGAGLGHVPLLISICTGARSIGIELEPAFVACAQHCAQSLNLHEVTFIQQDARQADLSIGTVFFLYTPFVGSILRSVLDLLKREAAYRPIRICTFGPCTAIVAEEPWLEALVAPEADRIALFCCRH